MISWVLAILLILALFGAMPMWPYSMAWGYWPSGLLGLLLIVVLISVLSSNRGWHRGPPV